MSKKRIVIFGYSGSVHIERWAQALLEQEYKLKIISLGGPDIPGLEVIRFPRKGKLSYFLHANKAVKSALEFNPDIIHVHYAGGYGIWGVKTQFAPLIVSVWGSDIVKLPKSIFYRHSIKNILSKANCITATSESLKKTAIALLPENKANIQVIPFGVKIPEQIPPLPDSKNISCIYLKHLKPVYAPDVLIKAIAVAKEKIPSLTLTLCGIGAMETELKLLTTELKLNHAVHFPGNIPYADIYPLIQKHHFMVMPSRNEGFGVAAAESFACARPVIATNVGGIPEIVTNDENGYLVEADNVEQLSDAIIQLATDKDKMIEMGRNGYHSVKSKYNWQTSVHLMTELYDSL